MLLRPGHDAFPPSTHLCVFCSQRVGSDEPVVFWRGAIDVVLHMACSGPFVLRLARDALEAEHEMRARASL